MSPLLERSGIDAARSIRYTMRVIQRKTKLRRVLRNDFMRDGAIVFASTMFVNILNFAIHFILSRKLGVVDYGVFGSLLSLLTIVGLPVGFITLTVVKFTAEFHAVGDRAKIRVLSMRILTLGAILGGIAIGLGLALQNQIAAYLHFTDTRSVVMAAVVLAISFVVPSLRGVLQGTQDFVALAVSTSIESMLKIALAVTLVYAGWGVVGIFAGYTIAGTCGFLYTLWAVRRYWDPMPTLLAIDARRLFQTTGAIAIGTSAITLIGFIDVPLVKHFFDPAPAGLYNAVSVCGRMIFFVVGFIPMLVLPKAAERAASGRSASVVLRQGIGVTLVLGIMGLALFLFVPDAVVRVTFGAAFLPAAKYIFAYGVAMSLLGLTNVVVTYKIGLHQYDFIAPLVAAVLVETLGIYAFHTTLWSVIGVMIGVGVLALVFCSLRLPQRLPAPAEVRHAGEAAGS